MQNGVNVFDKFPESIQNVLVETSMEYSPTLCNFINSQKAIELLNKHLNNPKLIGVHCDVDMDGIGTGYILNRFITWLGFSYKLGFTINNEKEHGIQEKHINYFNNSGNTGLIIILDSSCNELDLIKRFNGDVIVIDHHIVQHNELSGSTAGGEYVIVTNMVDNIDGGMVLMNGEIVPPFQADSHMSCGLVLYEFLKLYQAYYGMQDMLEAGQLYQWAGVTLFTDAIKLSVPRNQYYMNKTVHSATIEPTLSVFTKLLNSYRGTLDKSFINFTLAPRINKAIRAGKSKDALRIVLSEPHSIKSLDIYAAEQERALSNLRSNIRVGNNPNDEYVFKDLSDTGISKSYCGVIAAKLVSEYGKNAVVAVYKPEAELYYGSFRGLDQSVDYLGYFSSVYPEMYAQGHETAFGFRATAEQIDILMKGAAKLVRKDIGSDKRYYLTAGNMAEKFRGVHHIDDMQAFKRQQGILNLAIANSKLSTEEAINIMTLNDPNWEPTQRGKVYMYDICGLQCKAFERLTTEWVSIYVECSNNIEIYVRNVV